MTHTHHEPTTTDSPPGAAPTLDTLPDGSRVWVYAAQRPFTDAERHDLDALLVKVRDKWDVKQPGMRGCHAFVEDRFLVVGADESRGMLDGCSVDAMMSWVLRLEAQTGLRLVDRMTVHYRDAAGAVRSVPRGEFARLARDGVVGADTHVFDTTINRVEQWRAGAFEVPVSATWHAQAFL